MKRLWTSFALLALMAIAGCSKFDEINTNPETPETVKSSQLATRIVLNLTRQSRTKGFMQPYMLTKSVIWSEARDANQYNGWSSYDLSLTGINDAHFMAKFAENEGLAKSYDALMHFARAMKFFDQTMHVGEIPYKEALKGETEKIYFPKYDSQKEVFLGILSELELADKLFSEGTNFAGDPLFGGNTGRWRKIVNSFALHVLIQLSNKENDVDLQVKSRFKEILTKKPVFTSNADNFQVTHSDKAGQTYPFYKIDNSFIIYPAVSTEIIDRLKQWKDRRLFYYANPSPLQLDNGKKASEFDAYTGIDPAVLFSSISGIMKTKDYSRLNDRYTELVEGEPTQQLGYAHLCFVIAEAAARGWIADAAVDWYKKGIEASMTFIGNNTPNTAQYHHGMPLDTAYITAAVANYATAFPSAREGQIEAIITQKYLASFLQGLIIPYYDYRRTGYPKWKINPSSNMNVNEPSKIPVRWKYPNIEYEKNRANVNEAVKRQFNGEDEVNQVMWLLKP
ncbi:SusD/RagB family nutrient-binding outer membrane lipoprotein [Sphingobacterium thalpophilum]|uniref:SusD/RagB family nutrient-binding outer membrane lipoprotein n=1 Tax=Sphingobacterium thalpophilum TaxID=259 RepID=UPI0024A72B85|nr:SusD/RagB family nutrient-binding outer membrane lipoprotein [Sphingobacterium thalpophilum]